MVYRKKSFVAPQIRSYQGDAIIRFGGLKFYLGQWDGQGTPPRDVLVRYLRTVAELEEQFQRGEPARRLEPPPEDLPTDVAIELYLQFLENDPEGYRLPDGSLSPEFAKTERALKVLSALYGDTRLADFRARHLKSCRRAMLSASWWKPPADNPKARPARPWCRALANAATARVVRFFAWCEAEELLEKGATEHLRTLKRLKEHVRENDDDRKTVADDVVQATLPYLSPPVAAMVRLQRLTAARPSELARLRPRDIKIRGAMWIYQPKKHKTAGKKVRRTIPFGPAAQILLAPFIAGRDPGDYCFKPEESFEWCMSERARNAGKNRKTPVYPSELKRRAKAKKQRQKNPQRKFAAKFDRVTYRQAIHQGIRRAQRTGVVIPRWNPYALRHARLTEIQLEHGWEAAAAAAGHTSFSMTTVYCHQQAERALRLAEAAALKESQSPETAAAPATGDDATVEGR